MTAPLDGSFVNAADADPFTLAAAASDAGTGVASVEFLACATAGPTCSSWTSVDLDTTPAYTGAWTLPGDGERQVKAVATDNAGHTAEAVVTVTVDRTAPAASLTAPSAGANVRGTIALTASATDATSGVDSVDFQRSPAGASSWTTISSDTDGGDGWTGSLDTTLGGTPDGLYDLRVLVTDDAGNTQTDVAANVRVDNTAPTGTLTDPGQFLRGSLALSGTPPTRARASPPSPSSAPRRAPTRGRRSPPTPTAATAGRPASTRPAAARPTGATTCASSSPTTPATRSRNALPGRTIDNTKPTAAIANPGTNLRLTVTLGGTADDVTAGVATVAFEYDNGGGWQLISTDNDGSDGWSASLNTTLPATPDGLYAFRLTATDRAGQPGDVADRRPAHRQHGADGVLHRSRPVPDGRRAALRAGDRRRLGDRRRPLRAVAGRVRRPVDAGRPRREPLAAAHGARPGTRARTASTTCASSSTTSPATGRSTSSRAAASTTPPR